MKIAVLESDRIRSASICRALDSGGYECEAYSSAKKFHAHKLSLHFDMLVIGNIRGSPDPLPIIREVRSGMQAEVPVLLIAGNGEIDMIERALNAGASDFMCLPFRPAELKTRVGVLLARAYPARLAHGRVQYGDFEFDTHLHQARSRGESVRLTRREFELALLLFRHLDQPLSRATIAESVWVRGSDVLSRTIDTHVSRVRSKLNLRPEHGYRIVQVYGYGYRLERADAAER